MFGVHFHCKYAEDACPASHIHHSVTADVLLIFEHRLYHHIGSAVVPGAEGHPRIDRDVEPRTPRTLVARRLDGHLTLHDYGLEIVLPLLVPVARRHHIGIEIHLERESAEHNLQRPRVIAALADIGLEDLSAGRIGVFHERIVWKVGEESLRDFCVFLAVGLESQSDFNIFFAVHM